MDRPFLKMHGLGNDFVVFDARDRPLALMEAQARALCDRRRGIGADTVVIVSADPHGTDGQLTFFNADGSPAGACGNATRCIAWLVMEEAGRPEASLRVGREVLAATRAGPRAVTIDMGVPKLNWADIPLAEPLDTNHLPLEVGPRHARTLTDPAAVSMGNPHCIFFTKTLSAVSPEVTGPFIEHHPLFPERVNVSFAEIRNSGRVRLRVWERGAGLTLACGTAACATLVAGVRRGLLDRRAEIEMDGGPLTIEWGPDDRVRMTGPVALVFEGDVDIEQLARDHDPA